MLNRILMGVAALSLMATALPAPALAANSAALGACITCHDISPAKKQLVGPALFGLKGKKPVSAGIPFAKWDAKTLDTWLKNPSKVKPGTMMAYSVSDPKKRAEIVKAVLDLK